MSRVALEQIAAIAAAALAGGDTFAAAAAPPSTHPGTTARVVADLTGTNGNPKPYSANGAEVCSSKYIFSPGQTGKVMFQSMGSGPGSVEIGTRVWVSAEPGGDPLPSVEPGITLFGGNNDAVKTVNVADVIGLGSIYFNDAPTSSASRFAQANPSA